ncbi:MAG: hypothetical protein EPO39_19540 [Candidatus Manganitrophaceae bacterium]|nr:MAG: hypothetical protein EPO39_19540 [Candidatus Manganitrophaceae bacterium]
MSLRSLRLSNRHAPSALPAIALLLLVIFSMGTVYDACANEWPPTSSPLSSAVSTDSGMPSSSFTSDTDDCHCLCHFAFEPPSNGAFENSSPHQPVTSSLKESIKEPSLDGLLRPPISLS